MKASRISLVALTLAGSMSTSISAGTVCAYITDPGDQPLPHATMSVSSLLVRSQNHAAKTDRDGKVCIDHIPEGIYAVEVSLTGFMNVRYHPVRVVFPHAVHLAFRLPFGDVNGDTFSAESTLSGTLKRKGDPVAGIKICLFHSGATLPPVCDSSDEIGEYALIVPAGKYEVEMSERGKELAPRRSIDLSGSWFLQRSAVAGCTLASENGRVAPSQGTSSYGLVICWKQKAASVDPNCLLGSWALDRQGTLGACPFHS